MIQGGHIMINHSNHCENEITRDDRTGYGWCPDMCDVCKSFLCDERQTRAGRQSAAANLFNCSQPRPGLALTTRSRLADFLSLRRRPWVQLINFIFISLVLTNFMRMVLILPCVVWPQIKLLFSQIKLVKNIKIDNCQFNPSWHQPTKMQLRY